MTKLRKLSRNFYITHKTFDGLEPDVKVMIDEIIKVKDNQGELIYYTKEDMDKILEDISYRKIDCLKNKQRNTQKYHVLNIIERM